MYPETVGLPSGGLGAGCYAPRLLPEVSPSRVLRRALEQSLEKHVASTVLFEALGASPGVPQTVDDVLEIVRGPLRDALARRLDREVADGLLGRIEAQLLPEDPATVELPLDELVEETRSGADATLQISVEASAVPVVVLSASGAFAARLQLTLGEHRVLAHAVQDKDGFDEAVDATEPAIVLVDGTDFPSVDARDVIRMLRVLPSTTARVLWGAELSYGRSVLEQLEDEAGWVILELKEGISPLLDLVRSRRAGGAR